MKAMKLFLGLLCVALFLCACAEGAVGTEKHPAEGSVTTQDNSFSVSENDSIEQSYENSSAEGSDEQFSEEASGDESSEPSEPKEQKELFDGATVQEIEINGGVFRVEQIKKHFNGDDLVLLYIKNLTDHDYSVTIEGSYLDKDGNVLLTETQTFIQYYAEYENYFLFRPEIEFEGFTYTLSFDEAKKLTYVEYDGSIQEIRVTDVQFEFGYINDDWDVHIHPFAVKYQDAKRYPTISAYTSAINTVSGSRQFFMHWVLYNDRGEIIAIYAQSDQPSLGVSLGERFDAFPLYQTVKDELVWPERYLGEIRGLGCLHEVDRYPNEFEHDYETYHYANNYEKETIFDFEK